MAQLETQTRYNGNGQAYTVQVPVGTPNYFSSPGQNTVQNNVQTQPLPQIQQPAVITPDVLKPQTLITVPQALPTQQPKQTQPVTVPSAAESVLKNFDLTQNEQAATNTQQNVVANMLANLTNLQGESAYRGQLINESGINQKRQDLVNLNNQILQKQAEINQDDITLISKMRAEENRDTLLPFAQNAQAKIAGDAAIIRALKTSEIGVLNAQALGKQGDIQLAKDMINEAVDAKFAPYKEQNDLYKAQLEAIKPFLDKAEKKQALAQQTKLNLAMKEIDKVADFQKTALSNAILGKAPQSVINAINGATSIEGVIKAGKNYLINPKDELEMQKLRIGIAKDSADYQKTILELAAAQQTIGGTTGNAPLDLITASSKYGDKNLSDTQLIKVQQATNALSSLESLQGLLAQGKDGLNTSGPITGRKRQLITALGGDANAAAINATIQGLIPTIARGVFGEVGVLTDADIANYRKTVPNLTSTEAQNKLISIMMYDVLARSVGNILTTNAMNQVNVSNFAPLYSDTINKVNELKSNLGYTETTPISEENKLKLENGWNQPFIPQSTISNTLDYILNK